MGCVPVVFNQGVCGYFCNRNYYRKNLRFFYTANILKKYFCKKITEKFADIFATANITDITMFVAMHIFPHIFAQKICGKSRSDVSEWVRAREAII